MLKAMYLIISNYTHQVIITSVEILKGKTFSERRISLTLESNHKTNYVCQELTWVAITKTELS